jgi:hypothetical protein
MYEEAPGFRAGPCWRPFKAQPRTNAVNEVNNVIWLPSGTPHFSLHTATAPPRPAAMRTSPAAVLLAALAVLASVSGAAGTAGSAPEAPDAPGRGPVENKHSGGQGGSLVPPHTR